VFTTLSLGCVKYNNYMRWMWSDVRINNELWLYCTVDSQVLACVWLVKRPWQYHALDYRYHVHISWFITYHLYFMIMNYECKLPLYWSLYTPQPPSILLHYLVLFSLKIWQENGLVGCLVQLVFEDFFYV